MKARLDMLGDDLRFVFITSAARVHDDISSPADAVTATLDGGETFRILVHGSAHPKCSRCWHHREDVGRHETHPELCGRCVENVDGPGEQRIYA